jgi:hypothetical protein
MGKYKKYILLIKEDNYNASIFVSLSSQKISKSKSDRSLI